MNAFEQILVNLANLVKVKTILTLVIVFTFCFKTINDMSITSEFVMMATAVITYYFTKDRAETNTKNIEDVDK